ncbi:PaaI family thioesterase [Ralstonia pseudosolanacearum]|uniref:PaaI family thioesterase n=1 Tax=Ralstonia pseudosolanacearum TaxID=1310165 RepID=UPI0018D0CF04|nr:PaaI family thioesterase [Ralstonia pseudosolanacearum]MBX9428498.1 PaaI family thioesterase [Ralstonia pseudosolanacearum]
MHPQLSGLQLLQAMARGELPRASISDTIPMTMASIDAGSVRFTARANKRHLNPLGGVHGGFAATVLDSVTGCAIHSILEAGVGYGTVDLSVKRVKAVPEDTPLVAEGRVLHVPCAIGSRRADLMLAPPRLGRDRRCPAGHAPAGAARAACAPQAG